MSMDMLKNQFTLMLSSPTTEDSLELLCRRHYDQVPCVLRNKTFDDSHYQQGLL